MLALPSRLPRPPLTLVGGRQRASVQTMEPVHTGAVVAEATLGDVVEVGVSPLVVGVGTEYLSL
jgi:hypothetical protein